MFTDDPSTVSRRAVLIGGVGLAAMFAGCKTGHGATSEAPTANRSLQRALPLLRPSPNPYLSGNFAPVDTELTKLRLPIKGSIPSELQGTLLRNGPNPIAPDPAKYHWFTGDGMLHAIELRDGEARYRNRWVRTDTAAGLLGESSIVDQPPDPIPAATNRAQTSIVSHAGKTLALYEASLPTEVEHQAANDRALRLRRRAAVNDDGPSQGRSGDRRDAVLRVRPR